MFRSSAEAARAIGVTRQAMQHWKNNDGPVPAEHVLAIHRATGGAVRPYALRPDIYPDSEWVPPLVAAEVKEEAA